MNDLFYNNIKDSYITGRDFYFFSIKITINGMVQYHEIYVTNGIRFAPIANLTYDTLNQCTITIDKYKFIFTIKITNMKPTDDCRLTIQIIQDHITNLK